MRFALVLLAAACLHAQAPDEYRAWMDRGVAAYKSGRYADAAAAFQQAVYRNPSDPNAHLFLGSACMAAWKPAGEGADNRAWAEKAESEFQAVLAMDPGNESALASLGSLMLQEKRFDEAQEWYERLLRLSAADPSPAAQRDAHYALGMIAWSRWWPDYDAARKRLGMKQTDPGPLPDPSVRRALAAKWGGAIDNALVHLRAAWTAGKPEAAVYISRLIRERAALRDTPAEYNRDLREAEDWASRRVPAK